MRPFKKRQTAQFKMLPALRGKLWKSNQTKSDDVKCSCQFSTKLSKFSIFQLSPECWWSVGPNKWNFDFPNRSNYFRRNQLLGFVFPVGKFSFPSSAAKKVEDLYLGCESFSLTIFARSSWSEKIFFVEQIQIPWRSKKKGFLRTGK